MPVLDISDRRGNWLPDTGWRTLAVVISPHDAEAHAACLAALGDQEKTRSAIIERLRESMFGIAVAGDLLLLIRALALAGKPASVERAVQLWMRRHARQKKLSGRGVPASRAAVRAAWSRWRPVSPLCAAVRFRVLAAATVASQTEPRLRSLAKLEANECLTRDDSILLRKDYQRQAEDFFTAFDPAHLPATLALAESFRAFGERHFSSVGRTRTARASRPTLDPAETWRVPPDLELPDRVPPLADPGLPAIAVEDLLKLGSLPADEP